MLTGFIGAGNMAGAIIKGMLHGGVAAQGEIMAFDANAATLEALCGTHGVHAAAANAQIAAEAEVIVLAVKPHIIPLVLPPLQSVLRARKPLLVSIAAGTPLHKLGALLGDDPAMPIVRVMPNVNAQIGESMSALCSNTAVSEAAMAHAVAMFDALGRTVRIDEEQFAVFSAVACASPAFTFMFIEGLARAGLRAGMTKKQATLAAAQAVMGSARLVLEGTISPNDLIDTVCSPGGTTIAGVAELEEGRLIATVMKAVAATTARDKEMQNA